MGDLSEAGGQMTCWCPMRDGAHEATCSRVGEYDHIHCGRCDKAVWMSGMSFGMCKDCQQATRVWDWGPQP